MVELMRRLAANLRQSSLKLNEPLSNHTTFRIGGPAEFFIEAYSVDDLAFALRFLSERNIPYCLLGGGSNILVSDLGISGLVIKNNCREITPVSPADDSNPYTLLSSDSGVVMNSLIKYAINNGLGGLEYHLGLPGTVGGAVFMNSNFPKKNAFVGDAIHEVLLLASDGEMKTVGREYFNFEYDRSILQLTGEIVLSVVFKMVPENKDILLARGQEALLYRSLTQPKGSSAGCFFKNISRQKSAKAGIPEGITSAGYLIDKAGLKGLRKGDAVISDLHANYILNTGAAKASDIIYLAREARLQVLSKFGVMLEPEVRLLGFPTNILEN